MKNLSIYISGIIALICICGCDKRQEMQEAIMGTHNVLLNVRGTTVFSYDENKCQLAYNTERNEYRAMADDMSSWFVLKTQARMTTLDQEFDADLVYKTSKDKDEKSEKNRTFRIIKIDNSSGLVWLNCSSRNINMVVRVF